VIGNDDEDADDDSDGRADDHQPQLLDCAQLRLEERDISSPTPNPMRPSTVADDRSGQGGDRLTPGGSRSGWR